MNILSKSILTGVICPLFFSLQSIAGINPIGERCAQLKFDHPTSTPEKKVLIVKELECLNRYRQHPNTKVAIAECRSGVRSAAKQRNYEDRIEAAVVTTVSKGLSATKVLRDSEPCQTEVVPPSKEPSILDLIAGDYIPMLYSGSKSAGKGASRIPHFGSLEAGDILSVEVNDLLRPGLLYQHSLIVSQKSSGLEDPTLLTHLTGKGLETMDPLSFLSDPSEVFRPFRLTNSRVSKRLAELVKKRDLTEYSTKRVISAFLTRGRRRADEKKIVVGLLNAELLRLQAAENRKLAFEQKGPQGRINRFFGEADLKGKGNPLLSKTPFEGKKEMCSSFAGNSLLFAALQTKIDSYPQLRAQIKLDLRKNAKASDFEKALQEQASRLLANEEFREALELGIPGKKIPPSPVYSVDFNKMLPRNLFRTLIALNPQGCDPANLK